MKLIVTVILALAVAAIVLGFNDHKILACVSAYLSAVLALLSVNHRIHSRNKQLEAPKSTPEAHGCYEMDREK